MSDPSLHEHARREVRAYLANRPGLALAPDAVTRGLRHSGAFDLATVNAALSFLVDLRQVDEIADSLGSSKYYRATAEGILAHERGQ